MRTLFSKEQRIALAQDAADENDLSGVSRWSFVMGHRFAMFWADVVMTKKYGLPEDLE